MYEFLEFESKTHALALYMYLFNKAEDTLSH